MANISNTGVAVVL